ncbi:MAG: nickel pincer cofactor biosynthesis protein LarB [Verrucomicrobiota bacterium]
MNRSDLEQLLQDVSSGKLSPADATEKLATLPFEQLTHSTLDLHRELRTGCPEVIYGESKNPQQISDNLHRIHSAHGSALATRVSLEKAEAILAEKERGAPAPHQGQEQNPTPLREPTYHPHSRCLTLGLPEKIDPADQPSVTLVVAGTSDLDVAEEAALTLQYLKVPFRQINDVGVAGLHRLLPHLETLRNSTAIIAVAGMEGALPSVVAGLVACPVIAVPTSVGYGTARKGETALLAMLTSCASGLAVVNIDNGFGAAVFAHTTLPKIH